MIDNKFTEPKFASSTQMPLNHLNNLKFSSYPLHQNQRQTWEYNIQVVSVILWIAIIYKGARTDIFSVLPINHCDGDPPLASICFKNSAENLHNKKAQNCNINNETWNSNVIRK